MRKLLISIMVGSMFLPSAAKAQAVNDKIDFSSIAKSLSITQIISHKIVETVGNPNFRSNFLDNASSAIEKCSAIQFKFAQILNRNVEKITDLTLFNFIDQWWKTRYRYGGTTKSGIDCSAFTGLLLKSVYGVLLPRTARQQYAMSDRLSKDEITIGDLVFFNTTGGISHVGVYLGEGYFVHSCSSKGVYINNLNESYYSQRFISGGRPKVEVPGFENCNEDDLVQANATPACAGS